MLLIVFFGGWGSVLLLGFCFGRVILAAHSFVCFGRGIYVDQRCLFWEGIRVVHRFFVLGGGSVLLILFLFWEGDPCCSSSFVLGGGSVLFLGFCFGRGILAAYPFLI